MDAFGWNTRPRPDSNGNIRLFTDVMFHGAPLVQGDNRISEVSISYASGEQANATLARINDAIETEAIKMNLQSPNATIITQLTKLK